MPYSSIPRRKCKCKECKELVDNDKADKAKWPTLSCYGYNYAHLPPHLKEKAGTKTKVAKKNKANRQAQARKLHADQNKVNEEDINSKLWYHVRRYEMTGHCLFCGERTCKDSDNYKNSIAHIFAKNDWAFPSIKCHPLNFIELCFWGNSHHTNFDNAMITFEDIKQKYPLAWEEIVIKTNILYPLMTAIEQGRLPLVLRNEIVFGGTITLETLTTGNQQHPSFQSEPVTMINQISN